MEARGDRVGAGASGALTVVRWLLMIVLGVAAAAHVFLATWQLSVDAQSLDFYVINISIDLAPALAYAVAIVLTLTGRCGRVAWSVLLACGLAQSGIDLFYLVTVGFGELMIAPPCLVALSLLHLLPSAGPSRAGTR